MTQVIPFKNLEVLVQPHDKGQEEELRLGNALSVLSWFDRDPKSVTPKELHDAMCIVRAQ